MVVLENVAENLTGIPQGIADLAVSRDEVVGWERRYQSLARLKSLHGVLRPGGILGIIERRAEEGQSFRQMMEAGAVSEDHVISLAEVAGFRFVGRSEANARGYGPRMTLKFIRP